MTEETPLYSGAFLVLVRFNSDSGNGQERNLVAGILHLNQSLCVRLAVCRYNLLGSAVVNTEDDFVGLHVESSFLIKFNGYY